MIIEDLKEIQKLYPYSDMIYIFVKLSYYAYTMRFSDPRAKAETNSILIYNNNYGNKIYSLNDPLFNSKHFYGLLKEKI